MLRRFLTNVAYPRYECNACVGQERWQGCYCQYIGAVDNQCNAPKWFHLLARWLLKVC